MIKYRTTGPWGAGSGSNLTPGDVDGNFYDVDTRLGSIETNPPAAISIDHINQSGTELTIYMTDGSVQGPFTLPSAEWRWTGAWKPGILYDVNDLFSFQGSIYLVLLGFTSGSTFDPNVQVGTDNALANILAVPSLPYDIGFYYPLPIPNDSSVLAQTVVTRTAAIPANFAGSVAFLGVACSEPLSFPIVIDDVQVGSIQFFVDQSLETGGPGQFGTLVQLNSETINLSRLDRIQILAPFVTAGLDATAAGLSVTIAASTTGFSGSGLSPGVRSLEDDSDVSVTSPADGQFLTYDAASGTWKNKTGASTLAGDSDVSISGLADGNVLTWIASANKWENRAPSLSSSTLAGDTDVVITTPSDGQVLTYHLASNKWINSSLPSDTDSLATLTDVVITTPSNGDVLTYDSGSGKWVNSPAGADSDTLATLGDVIITSPANKQALRYETSSGKWKNFDDIVTIDFVLDGGGSVLTTGLKGYRPIDFACTILQATLLADQSGSIVVDIFKCTYAQFDASATHPVSGDKITASAPPTISGATKAQDATLTGWTIAIAAGDILAYNINSITTCQRVTVSLKVKRS